jgi:hypothetical protein
MGVRVDQAGQDDPAGEVQALSPSVFRSNGLGCVDGDDVRAIVTTMALSSTNETSAVAAEDA